MLGQLARFASVGVFATLVHVAAAFVARFGLGFEAQLANFAGFLSAVIFSYFGHGSVTFQTSGNHGQRAPKFGVVALFGLGLSSAITYVVCSVLGGNFVLAMGLVAVMVPGSTFLGSKFWVFRA